MASQGLDSILKSFAGMKRAGQNRVLRNAVNAALTPVLKEVRKSAPRGSVSHKTYKRRVVPAGFLGNSVIKGTRVSRDKGAVLGNVRLKSEAWYGSLLEHGWRPGKRSEAVKKASRRSKGSLSALRLKELGDNRVKKPGTKWFSKAVERSEDESFETYKTKIVEKIIKEFRKK